MHPYVPIFGRDYPTFSLMMFVGFGLAALVLLIQCKLNKATKQERTDAFLTASLAMAGAIIGAILLRPIMRIPTLIRNWDEAMSLPVGDFFGWMFGEMVFYGGLIGGALAALWFCRHYKVPFLRTTDLLAAAIPAGHAMGRVGCFFGGCCYGMEVGPNHPFAVIYPRRTDGLDLHAAPAGVPLLAIPLIEAAGNLIIAGIVMMFVRKNTVPGRGIALYGLLYSVQRFIIEFFRGDQIRGIYSGISTSQIISIGIFVISAVIILLPVLRKNKPQNVEG